MKEIFESILSASLSGSVIIALVLGLRLVLRNAPKRYICLLWLLAAVRLLIPFSIESSLSLQPDPDRLISSLQPEDSTVQMEAPPVPAVPGTPTVTMPPAATAPGSSSVQIPSQESPDVVIGDADIPQPDTVTIDTAAIATTVWATVTCGFLVYTAVSYAMLKRKVRDAVQVDEGIFECSAIDSPFLLGYVRPIIYLPSGIPLSDLDYILAHERAHIQWGDNWVKLMGFLCVAVHWFNPLVWVAYVMLCMDIEMACDEHVVKYMSIDDRKAYSGALLNCAAQHRSISACPVAFGEVSVKQRILKVLNYRKPGFWISIITVIAIVFVAVCFLTNPPVDNAMLLEQCRTALEEFQSTGCYNLLFSFENRSGSWLVLDSPNAYDDWNGNNRQYLFIENSAESSTYRLHFGDQYLQRDITYTEDKEQVDSGWYDYNWTGSSFFTSYTIADLVWEDYVITVKDSRTEQVGRNIFTNEFVDATIVTLHMEYNDREYDREFYLDEAGKLFRIDSYYLLSNDRKTVLDGINQHYPEAAMLEQCRQAVETWINAENYHLQVDAVYDSKTTVMNYSTQTEYLRSGDDWYHHYFIDEQAFDREVWEVQKDGMQHRRQCDIVTASGQKTDSGWSESRSLESYWPWFTSIDWNTVSLIYLETDGASGSRMYSFQLSSEADSTVSFCFNADGEMISIIRKYTIISELDTVSRATVTFSLISTDAAEITAAIESHYLEARLASSNDEANGAMSQ